MTNKKQQFTISTLSQEFDVTVRTLRFYEEKGLLAPSRQGNTRIYNSTDRVKLKLILRGKRLGFTLDESRAIIEMYNPAAGNVDQLEQLIAKIRQQRNALKQQLHDIELMMLDLRDAEEKCLATLAQSSEQSQQG